MRDHFGVMMTAAVVFSSLLFGALMIAARGAFASSGERADVQNVPTRVQPPAPPGDSAGRRN
jgi:hypothetical protein